MNQTNYKSKTEHNEKIVKIISQFCVKIEPFLVAKAIINGSEEENAFKDKDYAGTLSDLTNLINIGISIIQENKSKRDLEYGLQMDLWRSIQDIKDKQIKADKIFSVIDYFNDINRPDLIKEVLIENQE